MLPFKLFYDLENCLSRETCLSKVPTFVRVIWSEEVVMSVSLLRAFLANSVDLMLRSDSDLLETYYTEISNGKSVPLMYPPKTVLALGWVRFLNLLREKKKSVFSGKPLGQQIASLDEDYELRMGLGNERKMLDLVENVRHIIVHNDGKVDSRFLANTKISNLTVGDIYPLDAEFAESTSSLVATVAETVFSKISKLYLEVEYAASQVNVQNKRSYLRRHPD